MFCYAASEDSLSSEVLPLAPDLDAVNSYQLAEDLYPSLSAAAQAEYTVTDIYNLLLESLRAQRSDNAWGIPTLLKCFIGPNISAVPTQASSSILGRLATMSSNLSGLRNDLRFTSSVDGTTFTSGQLLFEITTTLLHHFSGTDGVYIDSILAQIANYTQSSRTILSDISSSVSDLTSYEWTNTNVSPSWYLNSDNEVISSSQTGSKFSVVFQNFYSTSSDIPLLYRIYVPIMSSDLYHVTSDFDLSVGYFNPSNNSVTSVDSVVDYYLEPTTRGTYIYLFGFRPHNVSYVTFTLSGNVQFDSSFTGNCFVMSFDSDSYQQIKQAFASDRANHFLEYLANNLVDPAMQQAKEDSQPVIDDTLDGFTGGGSAAPSTGDTGSMKGISGSVRSGLDTGASAGDAVSVFSNNVFWGWFSQDNSDKINNAYPAPDVNSLFGTRSPGDSIPDFIHGDSDYLTEHLGSNPW